MPGNVQLEADNVAGLGGYARGVVGEGAVLTDLDCDVGGGCDEGGRKSGDSGDKLHFAGNERQVLCAVVIGEDVESFSPPTGRPADDPTRSGRGRDSTGHRALSATVQVNGCRAPHSVRMQIVGRIALVVTGQS